MTEQELQAIAEQIMKKALVDAEAKAKRELSEIAEICPHCMTEVIMQWDIEADGYQAFCPKCGKRLMLCSECMGAKDNPAGECDWDEETDRCFRMKEAANEQ